MNHKDLRLTYPMIRILILFMKTPGNALYGRTIMKEMRMSSGVVYPALRKFTKKGWLKSIWEKKTRKQLRRPRRCIYKMTAAGLRMTQGILLELTA